MPVRHGRARRSRRRRSAARAARTDAAAAAAHVFLRATPRVRTRPAREPLGADTAAPRLGAAQKRDAPVDRGRGVGDGWSEHAARARSAAHAPAARARARRSGPRRGARAGRARTRRASTCTSASRACVPDAAQPHARERGRARGRLRRRAAARTRRCGPPERRRARGRLRADAVRLRPRPPTSAAHAADSARTQAGSSRCPRAAACCRRVADARARREPRARGRVIVGAALAGPVASPRRAALHAAHTVPPFERHTTSAPRRARRA